MTVIKTMACWSLYAGPLFWETGRYLRFTVWVSGLGFRVKAPADG